jgi:small conductance mechanosensitive channel
MADPTPLPQKSPTVPTHAQIIAQPSLETYLVDGGINVVAGIAILIFGWWLATRAAVLTRRALDRLHHFDETLKPLVASLVRYGIWITTVIAVLERFGVATTSLIAILGAAGLAVGLAIQGTLSNVASGVMLLALRPFKVGDWITVVTPNQSGTVREIGLFTTILISADQAYVSLPNSAVFGSAIINVTREPFQRLNFTVNVDADNNIDTALKIITETMAADQRILKVPPAATGVVALKDYSVELLVRCWVHNAEAEAVRFDLQKAIRDSFLRGGVAFPVQRLLSDTPPQNQDSVTLGPLRRSG